MADLATEIVSVLEIKREFRLGGETDASRDAYVEQDALFESQIQSAVSFVSQHIDAPLVDTPETLFVAAPTKDCPISLRAFAVKSVEKIYYWTPQSSLRLDPDGEILESSLGRNGYEPPDRHYWIWPPDGGWPQILRDSRMKVEVKRGLDITGSTQALKHAVILLVRQLYDGYREIRPTEAFYALIAPWRRYD